MEAGHRCVTFKCIATASILEVSLLLKLKGLIYGLKIKNKASALIHRLRRTIFRRGSGDHPTALARTIVSLCFPASEKDSGYWLEHSFLLPNCELSRHIFICNRKRHGLKQVSGGQMPLRECFTQAPLT